MLPAHILVDEVCVAAGIQTITTRSVNLLRSGYSVQQLLQHGVESTSNCRQHIVIGHLAGVRHIAYEAPPCGVSRNGTSCGNLFASRKTLEVAVEKKLIF